MRSLIRGDSSMTERLLAWLEPRENEMAALLSELVSVPTENPPGRNYQACAALLERNLCDAGLMCETHSFPAPLVTDTRSQLAISLISSFGSGKRTLYFHGHYDVVPAQ